MFLYRAALIKIITLSTLLFLLMCGKVKSQNSNAEMALYNIGFSSIVSGVGALINKKPNEPWGKVLLKGIGQGALGGCLVYGSKNLIGRISKEEKWRYGWYAKMVNSAGISIIENASSNRNFWEQWHVNIGFSRFELYTKEKLKLNYKIMPVSLLLTASLAIRNKFEFGRSLQTGEFVFSHSKTSGSNRGRAFGNVILIKDRFFDEYDLYAHEIVHIYQYYDYNFVNTYVNKSYAKTSEKSESFSTFNKRFHIDLNGAVLWPIYFFQEGIGLNNFFEKEANFWEH